MKLTEIKGIKEKRENLLNSMGIYTAEDMLNYFPSRYFDLSLYEDIDEEDSPKLIKAEITAKNKKGNRKCVVTAKAVCGNKDIDIVWFNQPYVYNKITVKGEYVLFGKCVYDNGCITLFNPLFEPLSGIKKLKGVMSVYRLCEGLSQSVFAAAIKDITDKISISSLIPRQIISQYQLDDLHLSYTEIHRPKNIENTYKAYNRIALESIYQRLIKLYLQGNLRQTRGIHYQKDKSVIDEFIKSLDIELTQSQKKCIDEILKDLKSRTVMNRLLQGDVGSGKTIVAFTAMYYVAVCGGQSVLISPTEILARQHYCNALKIFDKFGIKVQFLSGSLNKTEKDNAIFNIKNKVCDILITTHSVLTEDVEFADLRFAVCDEQHRFGVRQRSILKNKGRETDMLIMSATPLPRTLNLAVFGELSVSCLNEIPPRRAETKTYVVPLDKIKDMYSFIRKIIAQGRQIYIVSRSIESDGTDSDSAKKLYNELSSTELKGIKTALLHGAMNEKDKNRVITEFSQGKIAVLISTTIIEVGIDVRNAAAIIIYGADKFGLSQLHQLRGRVGRGEHTSYCFLLTKSAGEEGIKRLNALKHCNDGFKLAEIDLEMRGAGEFLGFKQHGENKNFNGAIADYGTVTLAFEIYYMAVKDINYINCLKEQHINTKTEDIILN